MWSLRVAVIALALLAVLLAPTHGRAEAAEPDVDLTVTDDYFTVDTGAGVVFSIRRVDEGSSTQSVGDLASLTKDGVEYLDLSRGSQVNSGFDWLGYDDDEITVSAEVEDDVAVVTVEVGELTHYYVAKAGDPNIYMATYFTSSPTESGDFARYIVRARADLLPNGSAPATKNGDETVIEASDILVNPDGTTISKHYSNEPMKDWTYFGATGDGVGLWIVRGTQEGGSSGPFYRSLRLTQGDDQDLTYMIHYGMGQTEEYRTDIANLYTLVFTDGSDPAAVDTSWLEGLGLKGYYADEARGAVSGSVTNGTVAGEEYTVGFANRRAQYWADVDSGDGTFAAEGMLPGQYLMTLYKGELEVAQRTVTVVSGQTAAVGDVPVDSDPASAEAVWTIGTWDGTPLELLNGTEATSMHPSDVRLASWYTPTFVVGDDEAADFPAYQWKSYESGVGTIEFELDAAEVQDSVIRVGITVAQSGARPTIKVNDWTSAVPSGTWQPDSRSLTVGTYRGVNTMYSFSVPASALTEGTNTLLLRVASGASTTGLLGPAVAYDALDMIPAVSQAVAASTTLSGSVTFPAGASLTGVNRLFVAAVADGESSSRAVEVEDGTFTLTGLDPDTEYALQVFDQDGQYLAGYVSAAGTVVADAADAETFAAGATDVAVELTAVERERGAVADAEGSVHVVEAKDSDGVVIARTVTDVRGSYVIDVPSSGGVTLTSAVVPAEAEPADAADSGAADDSDAEGSDAGESATATPTGAGAEAASGAGDDEGSPQSGVLAESEDADDASALASTGAAVMGVSALAVLLVAAGAVLVARRRGAQR